MKYTHSDAIDVSPGDDVFDVELTLHPLDPEDRIAGTVLSAEGDPMPGKQVRYSFQAPGLGMTSSVNTDSAGRFELVVWRRVTHSFHVDGDEGEGRASSGPVEPGTLDVVLQMGSERTVELSVTDPSGAPVEDYSARICVGSESSWTGSRQGGLQHPGGRISIALPGTHFWVEIDAVGYALGKLGPTSPARFPRL